MKRCSKCKIEFEDIKKMCLSGKYCKECWKEINKKWRHNNPEKHKAAQLKYENEKRKLLKKESNSSILRKLGFSFMNNICSFNKTSIDGEKITVEDVVNKLKEQGYKCYLTGIPLEFSKKKEIHFDHKIPKSKGGKACYNNLGITNNHVNSMKNNLTDSEFINICKQIAIFNS